MSAKPVKDSIVLQDCDLLGLSIEAERVIVSLGYMVNELFPSTISRIDLDIEPMPWSLEIDDSFDFDKSFDCLFEAVFEACPNIKNIGVGCYGPFVGHESLVNARVDGIAFTTLGHTTGGRLLSDRPLKAELKKIVDVHANRDVGVWIETDVAIESLGYIYNFAKLPKNKPLLENKNRTAGLIKADYGVGGTFMNMSERNAWHGVSHTEIGQVSVQEWPGEISFRKKHKKKIFPRAINPHSVEGMASIPALEYYFDKTFKELKESPDDLVWDREAWYLAQLAWTLTCFASPSNIVFSGQIMTVPGLITKIRKYFKTIKKSKNKSIPNYPEMHLPTYIDDYLQGLIEDVTVRNPAVCGALCFSALTSIPETDPDIPRIHS